MTRAWTAAELAQFERWDENARRLQIVLYAAGALLIAVGILEARRRARD